MALYPYARFDWNEGIGGHFGVFQQNIK